MTRLAEKIRKGLFSLFLAVFIARGLSFGAQLLLARLLLPKDFGLMAMALMLIYSFNLLQTLGISDALVVRKEKIQEAGDAALVLILLLGSGMAAVIYFGAPAFAGFFDADREVLARMVRVLVLVLLFNSLTAVPNMLLEKDLAFEKKLWIEVVPALGYAACSVILAWKGFGVWSLVYGRIFSALLSAPIVWRLSSFRPSFHFDRSEAASLLAYGKFIALGALASFVVANMDDVIVGKVLDFTALGFYAMAYTVSNLVVVNVSQLVNRVAFPAYARVSGQTEHQKKIFLLALRYIAMIAAPFSMLLITLGHDLTRVFLGEKWLPMVPALQIISLSAFLRALFSNTGPLFNGAGKPQYVLYVNLIQISLLALFLIPMTRIYGIPGTALGALGVAGVIGAIVFFMVNRIFSLSLKEIGENIGASLGFSFVAGLLLLAWTKQAAPAMGILPLTLFSTLATLAGGLAAYFLMFYFFNKKIPREMASFLKGDFSPNSVDR